MNNEHNEQSNGYAMILSWPANNNWVDNADWAPLRVIGILNRLLYFFVKQVFL